jgi:hypothetical protein
MVYYLPAMYYNTKKFKALDNLDNGASVNVTWVPKRMTYIAQPADQSWMAPFKSLYFKKWNHWLVHALKAFTPAGNMQSSGYARVVDWISEAWAELDSNMIASSFQRCGITSRNLLTIAINSDILCARQS